MAYSKQIWDTTSYVNPTRMNHIEDGIASADLTSGGTVNGTLNVTSNLQVYRGNNKVNIYPSTSLSANRDLILPNGSGTISLNEYGSALEQKNVAQGVSSVDVAIENNAIYFLTVGQGAGGGSMLYYPSIYLVWKNSISDGSINWLALKEDSNKVTSITLQGSGYYRIAFNNASRIFFSKMTLG